MSEDAYFSCRGCTAVIVEKGQVGEWRDLPSENWAEMMDFWHCHKPDDHDHGNAHQHKDTNLASIKGYGANTRFTAQVGVGFVDLASFLLAEDDCVVMLKVSYFPYNISVLFYTYI